LRVDDDDAWLFEICLPADERIESQCYAAQIAIDPCQILAEYLRDRLLARSGEVQKISEMLSEELVTERRQRDLRERVLRLWSNGFLEIIDGTPQFLKREVMSPAQTVDDECLDEVIKRKLALIR
jgi:hypothetical protein